MQLISGKMRATGVTVVAVVLACAGVTPAMASEDTPDSVAEQVSGVAPDIGAIVAPTIDGDSVVASGEAIDLVAASNLGEGIEVTGGEGATSMVVNVDFSEQEATAEVASDGSVVYASASSGDVVVQATADAVRIQTVIDDAAAAHEIPYSFEGGFLPGSDGVNFFLADIHNPDGYTIYSVEQPWAFDATGAPVATYLEIRGDDLVQVVEPSAATVYPIVADPTFKWVAGGFGAQYTRAETRDLANAAGAAGVCGVLTRKLYVGPYLVPMSAGCIVIAAYIFAQANIAKGQNSCIFFQFIPSPAVWRGCS